MRKYKFYRKYDLTRAERENAYWYAMRYNELKAEYKILLDTSKGISYSDMPHGSLNVSSPVEEAAIRAEEISSKITLIEETAREAAKDLYKYVLFAVTNRGRGYEYLKNQMNIPCGKNTFYEARRKFYYMLAKKI